MAYEIHPIVEMPLLCVEIVGDLTEHISTVTRDVRCAIQSVGADRVLLDLRLTYTRSTASDIFIQALKYRPGRLVRLALVAQREHEPLCLLLKFLLKDKGVTVASFGSIALGKKWLIGDQLSAVGTTFGGRLHAAIRVWRRLT
jgi:hypothetical protein